MTPPTSLLARRRLAKAAAILNDPDHPQHTLLADLVDTALALDPPDGWVVDGCSTCGGTGRVVAYGEEYTGETVACGTTKCPDCATCPPSGIARPRRGGLIVVVPG